MARISKASTSFERLHHHLCVSGVPRFGSIYSPLWVRDVNRVPLSSQEARTVANATFERFVERQNPKHRDPPPLQHHKRGVHHHSISVSLVRPRDAYGRCISPRLSSLDSWKRRVVGPGVVSASVKKTSSKQH